MAKLWQRRPLRLGGLMVGGLLLAFALTSCIAFSVTVNSVTGAYEPYNPMYATGGIPAEDVAFTVNGSPTAASLTCLIEVFTTPVRWSATPWPALASPRGMGVVSGGVHWRFGRGRHLQRNFVERSCEVLAEIASARPDSN